MKQATRDALAKVRRYVVHDVLHADDTAHRLAFGCAIGMFVAFTPTIPFQMALTLLFSWLLRANKVVGLPIVWLTNPVTAVPIYFFQYLVGCWVMGLKPDDVDFSVLGNLNGTLKENTMLVLELMETVFWPLWIGSLVAATILGALTYGVTYYAITTFRKRRPLRGPSEAQ